MTKKKFWPKIFGFLLYGPSPRRTGRFATLGSIFDFSFPSYGRFREGTPHFVILRRPRGPLTKTAVTRKRKVEKWIPRWQNDRNGEG